MALDPLADFWDSSEPASQPTDTILVNLAPASQADAVPPPPAFDSGQDPLDSFWNNQPTPAQSDSTQEPAPASSFWQTAVDFAANMNPALGLPKLGSYLADMIPSADSSGEPTYPGEVRRGAAGILAGANMLALRGLSQAHDMMPPLSEKRYQDVQTSLIQNMNHYREEAAKIPTDKVIKKYQDADGMGAYFALLVNDPIGSINAANHFLAGTIPKVAAGAGAFAIGGPVAAGFTMALADVADVTGGDMLAFLAARGVNVMNPDAVKSALNDQQLVKEMDRRGWTKGAIAAASDALFAGTGKLVMESGLPAVSKAVTDVLVGGTIGAGTAAGTQLATEGGIAHPGEVWAGALGGAIIPGVLHGAGKLANLGAKPEGLPGAPPEQPGPAAPEGTFLPKGPEPVQPAPRAPIDDILAQKTDANGLVNIDDLPTDIATRLKQERPDVIRKGGLFSGDKVHANVVSDMLTQDAASSDVRNAAAPETAPAQTSGTDPQAIVSDILSAKDTNELMAKLDTYTSKQDAAPPEAPVASMAPPTPAPEPLPATELSPQQKAAQKVSQSLTETITRNDGKPFSSNAAAKLYADAQGIKDYTFEPRDGGVVLKVAPPKKLDITQQEGGAQITKDVAELTAHPTEKAPPAKLPETVPLTHWGNTPGLTELDPAAFGTAAAGAEKSRQGPGFLPRTYYGMPGYKVENVVEARTKARYFTSIPKQDLYDLKADPLGLRAKAADAAKQREDDYFKRKGYRVVEPVTTTDVENEIAKAGFKGYFVDDVAAVFSKLPVQEVTHIPMEIHGVAGHDQAGVQTAPATTAKPRLKAPAAVAETASKPAATLEDFGTGRVKDLTKKQDWAMLTAENPGGKQATPEQNAAAMESLKKDLADAGKQFVDVEGNYGQKENSVGVVGITPEEALAIGKKYGQESVLTPKGLEYPDGRPPTRATGKVEEFTPQAGDDFYSTVKGSKTSFRVELDFGDGTLADLQVHNRKVIGVPREHAQAIIDAADQKFIITKTKQIGSVVVDTATDLPERYQKEFNKRGLLHLVRAFYDTDTSVVYYVADQFNGKADLLRTHLHEIGLHAGLRYAFGSKMNKLLDAVARDYPERIAKISKQYSHELGEEGAIHIASEELLADLAEENPSLSVVQKAYGVIRNYARRAGMNVKLNENDLNYIVASVRDAAMKGKSAGVIALRHVYAGADTGMVTDGLRNSLRKGPDPEKTQEAYKLFRVNEKKPGELFPLFVNASEPVPTNRWVVADEGTPAGTGKVKSKIGKLAYRPGWHSGDLPIATHIGSDIDPGTAKPTYRPDDQVWARVLMAADHDWQSIAAANAQRTKGGKLIARTAQITDQVPRNGFYRYKTNPNMTGEWLIGGDMKVVRLLTDDEVKAINDAAGVADLPRKEPFDPARYGLTHMFEPEGAIAGSRISPAKPTGAAKNMVFDPLVERHDVSTALMRRAPEAFKGNMARVRQYLMFSPEDNVAKLSDDDVAALFIRKGADNLKWLVHKFEETHPGMRERARLWYTGANKLAHVLSDRYDYTVEQVAGVMAALSPRKHWFPNVSLAERIIGIWHDQQDHVWDQKMDDLVNGKSAFGGSLPIKLDTAEGREMYDAVRGKALKDLATDRDRAVWVRTFDQAYNPNVLREVSPEGGILSSQHNARLQWSSYRHTANAVAILRDGSLENISNNIGEQNKVRNFYNNIVDPNHPGDLTADTHAVAALHLMPLAGEDGLVVAVMGSGFMAPKVKEQKPELYLKGEPILGGYPSPQSTGTIGIYGLVADAYRLAAQELSNEGLTLLPREVQSITWEAVRGLFEKEQKRHGNLKQQVAEIWRAYSDGEITAEEARDHIFKVANGIAVPAWARSGPGSESSTVPGGLRQPELGWGEAGGRPDARRLAGGSEAPETPRLSVSRRLADEQAQLAQRSPEEVARVARKVENVKAWFKDDGRVDVVGTRGDLPFVPRPGTRAAAWRGRVYLVADEITNRTDARNLYAHELVGHLKAEQVKGYHDLLGDIIAESTKPGIVRNVWQMEQDKRPWAAPDELAREVVAVLAERDSKHPAIRRIVNTYRGVLRKLGAINPVEAKIYDTIAQAYHQENVTYDNTAWSSVDVPGWTRQRADKLVLQYLDDTDPLKKAEAQTALSGVRNRVLLQRSYVVNEVDQALDQFVRPMEEARRRSGFTNGQVSNFLHARHALEANASLRQRNMQRMVDAGVLPDTDANGNQYDWNAMFQNDPASIPPEMNVNHPDYQYWHNLWEAPSGMTDPDARAILDEFQGDPDMQVIGDFADAIGKDRLDKLESSGFISADRRAQLESAYEHYVPLFRDLEDVNERVAIQGLSSKMARVPIRIRKGSTKQVSDVYSNLIADYQKIVIQASQNSVFNLFHDQVKAGLAGDMFKVNGTTEQVALDAAGNIVTKDVIDINPNESINGFVGGKRTYIVANKSDPLALTVVRAWNQMDHARIGAFMRSVTTMARFIARMVTSMSFDFLAGNAPRDIFTAQMNVAGPEIGGAVSGRAKMLGNWMQAFSQIYAHEVFGTGGTFSDVFENMKRGGGAMSWMEMFPDEPQKNMARIQARYDKRWYHPGEGASRNAQLVTTKAMYKLLAFFEHLGTATENATRATVWKAVYDASLARGRSQADSAERANMAARDTTADFLRTGTRSKQIGALYLFFNPTMQSNAKALSRIKENPKVRIPVLLAMIAAAAVQSMLARKFSDDDNKDGISNFDEPSIEWTKDRNLLYPIPKELGTSSTGNQLYVTQPIPYFYNIFTTTGNILGDLISGALKPPAEGNQIKNPAGRAAFRIASAAIDSLSPFGNPIQSSWSQTLAPTLMDLVVQGGANESAFGTPLYPDKAGPWDNRLMWQRSWKNTPEIYKKLGRLIHDDVFMGDDTDEGWAAQAKVDFLSNPEVLQTIAQQFGGGLVSLLEKSRNYDQKGSVNDITGLRRFLREPVPSQDLSQNWYAAKGVMDKVAAVLQGKDTQEIAAYRRDHPEMQLNMQWDTVNKRIARQRRQMKRFDESSPQYKNMQQQIETEQLQFIRALNRLRAGE